MVEQAAVNRKVRGSSPRVGAKLEGNNKMELVAWIGSILLAVCAVPQAIKTFREKNADSLSSWTLAMWGAGELLLAIYTIDLQDWALAFNYTVNLISISVIVRYKFWPKNIGP